MSALEWLGPGSTAFVLAAAPAGADAPSRAASNRVRSREAALAALGDEGGREGRAALEGYFRAGGRDCRIHGDPRFLEADWIGDDGGPGFRHGVAAVAELDGVGTVVVAVTPSARRLEGLVEAARRWPRKLFLVAGGEGAAAVTRQAENVASIVGPAGGAGLAGELAASLEAADFQPGALRRRLSPPAGLRREDCRWLGERRREAGLWRSIDEGTRWSVFDLDHELTWRRVEREVAAFLSRLELEGFFGGRRGAWSVACRSGPLPVLGMDEASGGMGPGGAVRLHVEVPASAFAGTG